MKKVDLITKAKRTIDRYQMLKSGDKVVVALSGGPDSVALLFVLLKLKKELDLSLSLAHVNHKLRGKESDQDQEFVRKLSSDLKLKLYTRSFQVKIQAKKLRLSVEECARKIRYDYLNRLAEKLKAQKIALGHNFNDQAETVLIRLIRGSGSVGLSGIPPVKERIIRPLIEIKREEIEDFLRKKKISYRIDSSNLRTDYMRNKVRLELLPILKKEYNPKIEEVLNRTAYILRAEEKLLDKESGKAYSNVMLRETKDKIILDSKRFSGYDESIKRFMIRNCVKKLKGDLMELTFDKVETLLNLTKQGKSGKRVDLLEDIYGDVTQDHLSIYKKKEEEFEYDFSLPKKKRIKKLGIKIYSEILPGSSLSKKVAHQNQWVALFDMEKLKPPLRLRSRKNGDKFRPLGMKGTKSVADFLVDSKVPRCERDEVMLLTSRGKIAWLVGYRINEDFKVTPRTKKILKIEIDKE
jgi:tRNA(Ile)-lysidine synthase